MLSDFGFVSLIAFFMLSRDEFMKLKVKGSYLGRMYRFFSFINLYR